VADYSVLDFGSKGDGTTIGTAAIQAAVDRCHTAGGGRVIFPAGGTYLSGTISIRSNVELNVERGAKLLASPDENDHLNKMDRRDRRAFITADGVENIAFTGAGVIDGNGRAYVQKDLGYIYAMKEGRPLTFFFIGCKHLTFRDITVRDGANWTVRFSGCDDLVINGIRIYNDLKLPNSDAIDLDRCRNVRISDCHIESGDDCIVLKALAETEGHGVCENIVVRGCTLVSTSAALIVGCEAHAVMRNVAFDSCIISRSHRGLSVHLSEGCDVENILFSNMVVETRIFNPKWWGRGEPIYLTSIPWKDEHKIGQVKNVRFINILCRSENGVLVQGWHPELVDGVLLENVRVEMDKWSDVAGGQHDLRPCPYDGGGDGPVGSGVFDHAISGFFIKSATNVTLRNCEVVWGKNRPDYFHHALETEDVKNLVVENFRGESADPSKWDAKVSR
jgi:Glycosyl hydrolases family 28